MIRKIFAAWYCLEIYETISDKFIDSTFDVAFSDKKTSSPTLIVDIEAEKLNQQN